jgi:serine/threonine-protein kinase
MLLAGRTGGFQLGQYRILEPLGRGGMGRVFKAVHQTMNRIVALKLVSSNLVKTEIGRQLFQREVRAAARLIHGNIATAYDANQDGDRHYLILEFVDGPNLEELVRDYGPLEIGQACDFLRQAAEGLQYAFEMGMVHRDIKPANLLVKSADGPGGKKPCVIKILDFGLARLHEIGQSDPLPAESIEFRKNTILGTPDFLSPEQARNLRKVDIRSDLYSLGCTFYFLLTGQVPFPGGTNMEKLVRHGTADPIPAEQLRPPIPPGVAFIIRRLMAKDPNERYQTPGELALGLAPFAKSGPPGWIGTKSARKHREFLSTPSGDSDSGSDFPIAGSGAEEESILASTVSPNYSATPFSATGISAILLRGLDWQTQKRRLKIALFLAIATGIGLLAWVGWLIFHP